MMTPTEQLYNLLPTLYRQIDLTQGQPLQALLDIMEQEYQGVRADIDDFYRNLFIETCDDWVIPYIGDLLGVELEDSPSLSINQRRRVANSLDYRRRKGQAAVIEQLINATTGLYAHVVEFLQRLAVTQTVQHLRPGKGKTALIRDVEGMSLLNTAFDPNAHTAEILDLSSRQPKYAVNRIGLFVWRLNNYLIVRSPAFPSATNPNCYTFSPLGLDMQLYNAPQPLAAETDRTRPVNLPIALQPPMVNKDFDQALAQAPANTNISVSNFYGPGRGFFLEYETTPGSYTPVYIGERSQSGVVKNIILTDLSNWTLPATLTSGQVAVDLNLGRIALPADTTIANLQVSYNYAFSANIGGGPYSRIDTLASIGPDIIISTNPPNDPISGANYVSTFTEALAAIPNQSTVVIEVQDNGTYIEPAALSFTFPTKLITLTIQAADGCRPSLKTPSFTITSNTSQSAQALFTMNGLLIAGQLIFNGNLAAQISHTTLVPNASLPSVSISNNTSATSTSLSVEIDNSIVGAICLPKSIESFSISDSIIDSAGKGLSALFGSDSVGPPTAGPCSQFQRVTVFGAVYAHKLILASDSIFRDPIIVDDIQIGCVRYCSLPTDTSVTPPRYRCQPDFGLQQWKAAKLVSGQIPTPIQIFTFEQTLIPQFTSTTYGQPAYAQLSPYTSTDISAGAENGSEMGAFQSLGQPQNSANINQILQEYLPAGLQPTVLNVD